MQAHFDRFKDAASAAASANAWRFTKEEIAKKAEAAQLDASLRRDMAGFLDFAAAHPDVLEHLWQWYYMLYESGEDIFPIIKVQKTPRHPLAEEKFPGVMESVLYLAAADHFFDFIEKNGLTNSEFNFRETYFWNYRRMAEFNFVRDKTYALLRLGYFLYGYSRPFMLTVGRLNYEIVAFKDFCEVWEGEGKRVVLALPTGKYGPDRLRNDEGGTAPVYEQSGTLLSAHTFDPDGCLSKEPITLDTVKYTRILAPGDKVVTVHIPAGGALGGDVVSASLSAAQKIFRAYFADFDLRGFVCHSWLIDPQLTNIFGENSNTVAFAGRFENVICAGEDKNALYEHIFRVPTCPVEALRPENRFQREILAHIQSGKKIRAGYGFLKEEEK